MAYNSNKGNQHSGDIQYESDPNDTQIDFENDYVALKTNGQRRFIVSGSFITSSVPILITPTVASAFSIKGSTAGLDVNCAIENTGTDSDDGVLMSYTAQGSAGDPSIRFVIAGNEAYSVGIDNSDGDKFKISNASTLHTDTRLTLHGPKLGINTSTPAAALDVNGSIILGSAASDVVTLTGQVTASAEITGTVGRFTELRVSNLVGGSPISISASSITFTGSVDYGSTGSHGFYSGSAIHEFSATGSYTSGSGGSTEVSGGHIIISGSSPAITIHEGDLIVSGNTYLGDAVSDVVKIAAQVTASAGVLLNSTLDVGGNTTLGNAAGDTLNITGRTTATGNVSASLGVTGSLLLATGSAASVAVGKKSPVNTNMLYVNTQDNDNRVPLFVTNTAEQTILAATGSGHVLVGGKGAPVIDAKLNVSGSDLDQLLSCRSDSYAQVFHVSGSGNTFVSGNLGVGTASPEVKVDVNGNAIRIRSTGTPSSASDFGTQGEIRWDANYIYVCIATDTWKRVAISTW